MWERRGAAATGTSTDGSSTTANYRVGLGYDSHRLVEGGPLRIGGWEIPFGYRLAGHSDADVLLHAVTDALLGAAALGDIGELFPDTDPAHRGRDSGEMLRYAYAQVLQAGYRLVNLDCVVHAQQPKLSPHKAAIRQRMAETLGVRIEQVGLKAKTGEGVGSVGLGQIIEAQCVVLLDGAAPDSVDTATAPSR